MTISNKPPGIDKLPPKVHGRQPVLCRQVHEASSLIEELDVWLHNQSIRACLGHFRESSVEIGGTSHLKELKPYRQRLCRDFCSLQHVRFRASAEYTWQPEESDPTDPRNGLREQFQTLADEVYGEVGNPRGIATRPRKAGDEPAPNRIGSKSEDDGDGRGRLFGGQDLSCVWGHDDMNLERNQFGRKSGEPVELPLGISVFNYEVAILDVTEVTQSLTEGLARLGISGQVLPQPAYSSDLVRLLGVRGDRPPNRRAAEKCDELTPPHAMPPITWLPEYQMADHSAKAIAASRSAGASGVCLGCAPCQGGALQWVQLPPGNRSS